LLATAGIVLPGLEEDEPPAPGTATEASAAPESATSAGFEPEETAGIASVLAAIDSGESLPYEEDGQTFQNREGLLPSQPIGYYREYTVETPGSPDRGARRLVIGEAGETYYTADRYASFIRIEPSDYTP